MGGSPPQPGPALTALPRLLELEACWSAWTPSSSHQDATPGKCPLSWDLSTALFSHLPSVSFHLRLPFPNADGELALGKEIHLSSLPSAISS